MKKYVTILILLFSLGCQFAEAQGIKGFWNTFFQAKNKRAYQTIGRLFAPNSEFLSGKFNAGPDGESYSLSLEVRTIDGTIFASLQANKKKYVIEDISYATSIKVPPAESAKILKSFATEMRKTYNADAIKWIEKKMGKPIEKMNNKEMCIADLTLLYWTSPAYRSY